MPTSDSSLDTPSRHHRPVGLMSPSELSSLYDWAAGLRDHFDNTGAAAVQAAALCHLLDLRGRAATLGLRASIDVNIDRLLEHLAAAGLTP